MTCSWPWASRKHAPIPRSIFLSLSLSLSLSRSLTLISKASQKQANKNSTSTICVGRCGDLWSQCGQRQIDARSDSMTNNFDGAPYANTECPYIQNIQANSPHTEKGCPHTHTHIHTHTRPRWDEYSLPMGPPHWGVFTPLWGFPIGVFYLMKHCMQQSTGRWAKLPRSQVIALNTAQHT